MSKQKAVYRKKISVAIDLLSEITVKEDIERDEVVKLLKQKYEEMRLSPFRGIAQPSDIYDKEMTTLYVIGKYGMDLMNDFPEVFEKVFFKETEYEKVLNILTSNEETSAKREKIIRILGREPTSNDIARILRILFTKTILGFSEEGELVKAFAEVLKTFPENQKDVYNFGRFYIGFKIAEMITTGEIKSKVEKEAVKQAMNITLNMGKNMPDDRYIYIIAKKVFKVPDEKLERILSYTKKPQPRKEVQTGEEVGQQDENDEKNSS